MNAFVAGHLVTKGGVASVWRLTSAQHVAWLKGSDGSTTHLGSGSPVATMEGAPADLLLAASGRPHAGVSVAGDASAEATWCGVTSRALQWLVEDEN